MAQEEKDDAKDGLSAKDKAKEAARQKLQAAAKKAKEKLSTAVGDKEDKRAKLAEAVKKARSKLSSTGAEDSGAAPVAVISSDTGVSGDATDADAAAAAYHYQLQLAVGEMAPEAPAPREEQVDMESPAQQAYLSLVALGQIAEESCTFATSAATFVASAGTQDPNETSQMSIAAQQACDRAKSASETLQAYTRDFRGLREAQDWIHALVMKVQKDAETCEQAAQSCHHLSNAITKNKKTTSSPVPCRWFLQGKCHKGMNCTFLHDLSVLEPRPLTKKSASLCLFFDSRDGLSVARAALMRTVRRNWRESKSSSCV